MDESSENSDRTGATQPAKVPGRGVLSGARDRAAALSRRGQQWVEDQDPASRTGTAIGAWKRYQAVEGPLQSLLLTAYVVIAVLPALLVMEEYLDNNPGALTNHLIHHFDLSATTAALLRSVLVKTRHHELVSALIAVAGALFVGLNYGRVLQLVHSRAWGIKLQKRGSDTWRYAVVLLGLYGLILLLLAQNSELAGNPSWAALTLTPGWIALLVLYFAWAPWLLTHGAISLRNLFPGAGLTALLIVALMIASSYILEYWINWYAGDYGGFGVVMAIFFWIGFASTIIVTAASLAPALAQRRELRSNTTHPNSRTLEGE
jgi:membrane protein